MRHAFLAVCAAALLLAGCSSKSPDSAASPTPTSATGNHTALAPLHFQGTVSAGADPSNFVPGTPVGGGQPCSLPTSTCYKHAFTIPGNASGNVSLVATLKWSVPANDLDLYLYQDGTQVSMDGINSLPPGGVPAPEQVMHVDGLAPGNYEFWVSVWNGAADAYTLDVTFG
jgi:hypothetical protein